MLMTSAAVLSSMVVAWPAPGEAQRCPGRGDNAVCETTLSGPSRRAPRRLATGTESVAASDAKVSSRLHRAMAAVRARGAAAERSEALGDLSTPVVRVRPSGATQIQVTLVEHRPEHVAQLQALGLQVEHVLAEHKLVQGWALPAVIEAIAALDFVKQVRPPDYPVREGVGAQNTAGDAILRAAEARSVFGVTGAGVKVGIVSDGINQLGPSVTSGDLPAGVQVLKNPGGNEGTAMAEIVADVAPGAALAFYGPETDVDMAVGINALRDAGARVVVDDLTFFGQAKFQDDFLAQTQRAFATAGRVYVSAAGNRALQHYRSVYNRMPGQVLTDYVAAHAYDGASDIGNTLNIPSGCSLFVNLHWNNPKGQSGDDFDLFLVRTSDSTVLEAGVEFQSGGGDAFESLFFDNSAGPAVQVYIAILEFARVSPPSAIVFDYFATLDCTNDPGLQYVVVADSVPGNHAVEETVVPAAINAQDPGADDVASYSSQGPATVAFPVAQVRRVPNVSATDCVVTQTGVLGFFQNPFCGTSASAPHLAGIAALLIQRNPGLNSQQLHGLLTGTAADVGFPGYDFVSGFGRADAVHAADGAAPGGPILFSSILPASRAVAPGATATAFLTILNAGGTTATGVRMLSGYPLPLTMSATETNPATNVPIGVPDAPVDIPAGGRKTFVIALTPHGELAPIDVLFNFVATNSGPAPTQVGVNSVLLSAASGVPDIVALAATTSGDGIARVPGVGGTGAFSVATVNVGSGGPITVTADTGSASLPLSAFVCQTNPANGQCLGGLATSVATSIGAKETPTFAVFVVANAPLAFDPAVHRVFLRFRDAGGVIRGATSVAIQIL
jgi:hypothetical protein